MEKHTTSWSVCHVAKTLHLVALLTFVGRSWFNVSGVMQLADGEGPRKRPPPRLESLKIRKEQEVIRKEDIDEKMRQVEERRKVQQIQNPVLTPFNKYTK